VLTHRDRHPSRAAKAFLEMLTVTYRKALAPTVGVNCSEMDVASRLAQAMNWGLVSPAKKSHP
jgi:hypothetical protein